MIIVISMKPASISQTKTFVSTKHIAKIQHRITIKRRNTQQESHLFGTWTVWTLCFICFWCKENQQFPLQIVSRRQTYECRGQWTESKWRGLCGRRDSADRDIGFTGKMMNNWCGKGGTTVETWWKLVEFYGLYVWRHLLKWWTFL